MVLGGWAAMTLERIGMRLERDWDNGVEKEWDGVGRNWD